MKKVLLTGLGLLIVVTLLFLNLSDPGVEESLDIEIKNTTKNKPVKTKAEVIDADRKDKEEQEYINTINKNKRAKAEESKLDFGTLFRKEDKKDSGKIKIKEIPAEQPITVRKQEVVSQNKPKSVRQGNEQKKVVVKEKYIEPEQEEIQSLSFSTADEDIKPEKKNGKNFTSNNSKSGVAENVVRVSVYGDYALKTNMKVEFILLEALTVNGVELKPNTIFHGYVKSAAQRITFRISSIKTVLHPFEILDNDYEVGIFNSSYVNQEGQITRSTSDNVENQVISESGINEYAIAQEILRGGKKVADKKSQHDAYLENGKKYYLKY